MSELTRRSTKEEILYLLKTEGAMTVSTIASRLGITEMAIRRHLGSLEKEQLISADLVRQAMGRPTHLYTLTEEGLNFFPKTYEDFSVGLLEDIEQELGYEQIKQLFKKRESRLQSRYTAELQNLSFVERLQALTDIQSSKGYMAMYRETAVNEYELIEYNCPIAKVAKRYKLACQCELSLFKTVLQTEQVVLAECLADGDYYCRYKIRRQDAEDIMKTRFE